MSKENSEIVRHPIKPVYDAHSKILILGSFPSVKSREQGFFYGHPRNRFWRVVAKVFGKDIPRTVQEKREFLLKEGIAVWDVLSSCEIAGSADSTIKNATANDLSEILRVAKIRRIFVNGKTAEKYYNEYILPTVGVTAICLPSTSPANAACTEEKLISAWQVIKIL